MSLNRLTDVVVLFVFCVCVLHSYADDEKVIQYDSTNFDKSISGNNHFVMFYAPWCGHCKRLHPVWEQLAEMLNEDPESQVTIAKVDCTTEGELCGKHDVTGYPTLKFFKLDSEEQVKFRGTRDLPSLTTFINQQLGKLPDDESESSATVTNGLAELTESNFESTVSSGNHFVKFYAPWCGHCQKLAPTWEELAKTYEENQDISIAKVDCTVHRTVCNKLEIKGYPTLLYIQNGNVLEKYTGQRSHDDLRSFVNRQLSGSGAEDINIGNSSEKDTNQDSVPQLTADTFIDGVSSGVTFVKFYAPWCGHCKRLAPTWFELSQKIKNRPDVKLVSVDCTQASSKELCNEQEVEGFPTLFLYRNGEKLTEYNGSRNLEDLYEFLSKYFVHDEL